MSKNVCHSERVFAVVDQVAGVDEEVGRAAETIDTTIAACAASSLRLSP